MHLFVYMKMSIARILIGLLFVAAASASLAQRPAFAIGASYGGAMGINESIERPVGPNFRLSLLYLRGLSPTISLELGVGQTVLRSGENEVSAPYETNMIPLDVRFRYSPLKQSRWSPYLFGGLGITLFDVWKIPEGRDPRADISGGNLFATGGAGLFHALGPNWAIDITLGGSTTLEDDLNPVHDDQNDGWWFGLIGIHYLLNNDDPDSDDDKLSNSDETIKYKTDPHTSDTDGDGLSDGEEIRETNTNPLKADTDDDGLSDRQEVRGYKTNPSNPDTDKDQLTDGQEVHTHKSNPLNTDSDADGLYDTDEVIKYKTNPVVVDSDGDTLSDGDEILKHRTDPLHQDTDRGSVPDGVEVRRNTNPLNARDDK